MEAARRSGCGAGSQEEGSQQDLSASLEADTDVLFADSPTHERQPELPISGEERRRAERGKEMDAGSLPDAGPAEGVDNVDEYGECDEGDWDEKNYDEEDEEDEDGADESAAQVRAGVGREDAAARRRRAQRRARRPATLSQRRASSSRLAQLALPVERGGSAAKRVALPVDSSAPSGPQATAAQRRERRLRALENMAAEYAAVEAQLSSEDRAAVISQMEAMYSEVLAGTDGGPPHAAPSPPVAAANTSATSQQPSTGSPSRTAHGSTRKSPLTGPGDPWEAVRKSAAAMEHSVRQYAGSSERRPKTVPPTRVTQSVEEAELLRSVQQVLGESMAVSSDLSRSSVSDIVSSNVGSASSSVGAATRTRWDNLARSRAVQRPPCTLVRWLETGWHHCSSATNSHGFELRTDGNSDGSDNDSDSDIGDSDDAASFVRFVRRHATDLGSFSKSDLWERESSAAGAKPVRSSMGSMRLPPAGLSRAEVNTIGRNYLDHCHSNGPKERAVRKAQRQATALINKGRYVEAIRLIDEGLVAARERQQVNEIQALSKLCMQGRLLLVSELNTVGRATEAIRICTAGLQLLPDNPELQGALDGTVPQVLAAEECLDAATTSLAMQNLGDAMEAMLQALQLDVASARLPPLLEHGARMAKEQGDDEAAALLHREAAALGAFDRQMQAAWVAAERAEHARTSMEQQSQGGLGVHLRNGYPSSASSMGRAENADTTVRSPILATQQPPAAPKQSRSPRTLVRSLELPEQTSQLRFSAEEEDDMLSPWVSGE